MRQGLAIVLAAMGFASTVEANEPLQVIHSQELQVGGTWTGSPHLVSVSGETLAVAGPGGTAHIYSLSTLQQGWALEQVLSPQDTDQDHARSIAVSGDRLAVAVEDRVVLNQGSTLLFERVGGTWALAAELTASDGAAWDDFGRSLVFDGDRLYVGSPGNSAVYVFDQIAGSWVETDKIEVATDTGLFGYSIALDGPTGLVVGAPLAAPDGAVHHLTYDGTDWVQDQVLVPGALSQGTYNLFGRDVALDGDVLVVADENDSEFGLRSGAAYVYERTGTTWSFEQKIVSPLVFSGQHFAPAVEVEGDLVILQGSTYTDQVHMYRRLNGVWTSVLTPDENGEAVAYEDGILVGYWEGEVSVRYIGPATSAFCAGAEIVCPCGNQGVPDAGCDTPQSTGGVRAEVTTFDPFASFAVVTCSGFPAMSSPGAVLLRSGTQLATPAPFGDGVRCVGVPVVRLGATTAVGGSSVHAFGHGAGAGAYHYQAWYRSSPAGFCTPEAFNASSGVTLVWP